MQWLSILLILFLCHHIVLGAPPAKKAPPKEATQKIVNIAATIQNHEHQLSTIENDLAQTRSEESTLMEELDHTNQRLMDTIHYLRHSSQYSPLLAMLSASRPQDVIHSSMLLRSITPEMHIRNQQLLEKVTALSIVRQKLEEKQNQLLDITFKYQREKENLDGLLKLPHEATPNAEITPTTNELKLIPPVVGKRIQTFGASDAQWSAYNQGLLFVTRSEAQVVSPLSGTIVFAGEYANADNAKSKGKMVSIQTPNYLIIMSGLSTLNRRCLQGQTITVGEPIGTMNKVTGKKSKHHQDMPKLYLEVWRNEEALDPQSLLEDGGKAS